LQVVRPPPRSALFPYTPLFRSHPAGVALAASADTRAMAAAGVWRMHAGPVHARIGRAWVAIVAGRDNRHGQSRACIGARRVGNRSEEHTSELQSLTNLVCRLLL